MPALNTTNGNINSERCVQPSAEPRQLGYQLVPILDERASGLPHGSEAAAA